MMKEADICIYKGGMVERALNLEDCFMKQKDLLVSYWRWYKACYQVQ